MCLLLSCYSFCFWLSDFQSEYLGTDIFILFYAQGVVCIISGPINLYFYEIASQIEDNIFCYWVNIDERTIISHFCHWFAPWVNNTFSPKLNDTYKNYYIKIKN